MPAERHPLMFAMLCLTTHLCLRSRSRSREQLALTPRTGVVSVAIRIHLPSKHIISRKKGGRDKNEFKKTQKIKIDYGNITKHSNKQTQQPLVR